MDRCLAKPLEATWDGNEAELKELCDASVAAEFTSGLAMRSLADENVKAEVQKSMNSFVDKPITAATINKHRKDLIDVCKALGVDP